MKLLQKSHSGVFWAIFAQNWTNKNFPRKSETSGFRISHLLTPCTRAEKPNKPILKKLVTDCQPER